MTRAVVDVGSNSILLLVSELREGAWTPVFETSEVTGLGEGVKATGMLGELGMSRTLDALARAFEHARSRGAQPKAYGTMALRLAKNTAEFLESASAQGTPVEVISGDLEAELGMASVLDDPLFAGHERVTVVDVGGHSTEIATTASRETVFQRSFPVGTLGLRSGLLASESLTAQEILRASAQIDDVLGMRYLKDQTGIVVALGATGTNLVTIREKMLEWDPERVHGAYLDFEEISKFVASSCRLTDAERAKIPGIEKGRENTIHIGALILERALQAVHSLGCTVSVRGWRHAMLERVSG